MAATSSRDYVTRNQVYLERFKGSLATSMDPAIRELDAEVQKSLLSLEGVPNVRALRAFLEGLRKRLSKITDKSEKRLFKILQELSDHQSTFNASVLRAASPQAAAAVKNLSSTAAWVGVLAAPMQATGKLLEPFVATWGASAIDRVEGAIRIGYAQGKTNQQIVQAIRGTKANEFQDGILGGVIKRDASAMTRTAVQQTASAAQQLMYAQNEDIIDGYMWIATLDSKTSETCMSLDGQKFKVGKGPFPPIHINCRSATIPIIDGVDLLSGATRASADGQVSAKLTYFEWLKGQPASFQDDALGPTRGKLFRNGGLSSADFARLNLSKNFEPMTLDEMRKKNPAAFKRAGI